MNWVWNPVPRGLFDLRGHRVATYFVVLASINLETEKRIPREATQTRNSKNMGL